MNESEYRKHGLGWIARPGSLDPGEYTVSIRANSLAQHGNWSAERKFVITDLNAWSWHQVVLISFLVIGCFALLTGVISLYVFKKARQNLPQHLEYVSMNPEYMPAYEPDEWEVSKDNIKLDIELGEGSFGKVYKGTLYNTIAGMAEMECAVKTVNDRASARDKIEFLQEASLMKAFNCHHVVKLLGVMSTGSPVYVCMELMSRYDLKKYLRKCRPEVEDGERNDLPSKAQVHLMACQIADGMAYLAAKKYVHRDLAARNCMLAADLTVKIGDFGMTRDVYETDYYRKGGKGKVPVRWMAPESLRDGIFSSQSDVWSFGVVLWEIVTLGEQPYQGYSNEKVVAFVKGGGNPGKPENCPEDLFSVMSLCWSWHQKARPTFGEVIDSLLPEIEDSDLGARFRHFSYYLSEKGVALPSAEQDVSILIHHSLCLTLIIITTARVNTADGRLQRVGYHSVHSSRGEAQVHAVHAGRGRLSAGRVLCLKLTGLRWRHGPTAAQDFGHQHDEHPIERLVHSDGRHDADLERGQQQRALHTTQQQHDEHVDGHERGVQPADADAALIPLPAGHGQQRQ